MVFSLNLPLVRDPLAAASASLMALRVWIWQRRTAGWIGWSWVDTPARAGPDLRAVTPALRRYLVPEDTREESTSGA